MVRFTWLRGVVDPHGAAAVTGTLPDYVSPSMAWGDVARPTARVLTLLELLQSGGTRTSAELAERLNVDGRTVRRYVEHLRDLGIPVDSVRGRHGGYRLARHYRMPPLMLTDEEALAVVWGLLLTGRSGSGPASIGDVEAATSKVRRVLPPALARQIDAVVGTVNFTGGRIGEADHTGGGEEASARVLLGLAQATGDRRPVAFDYMPRHGRARLRTVHPHGIVAMHGLLYLTGHDVGRQAERTFRLDRIAGLRLLEGTFEVPDDLNPVQRVVGPLAAGPGRHEVSVLVDADAMQVRALFPETLASVEPVAGVAGNGHWLRIFVRAERLEWVAGRLAALDRPFVIEQPKALHGVVAALGQKLIAAAIVEPGGDSG
ncbi:helix-turn-helix transcriptional regulator [Amycolatopsis sp. NBC_00348]|uniref:helix-turn-helix transcriptional regulator n=1 Tax=Amycolatopsis sp. NBC_00348 TaxID=2975956 RepID=UPI002E2729D2